MRITSEAALTPDDFHAWAKKLGAEPFRARKAARVAARRAEAREAVETRWNGVETRNVAEPGDWIVTSLDAAGAPMRDAEGALNVYVIRPGKFAESYVPDEASGSESEHGAVFAATGAVSAFPAPEGFDIVAPWGERQTAPSGYLLLNGEEVYGNATETFEAAYERIGP